MSHSTNAFASPNLTKYEKYQWVQLQLRGLIDADVDAIANLANVSALLKEVFDWWWVGFYRLRNNRLVLGPFQGPVACTQIAKNQGVCGCSWATLKTLVVLDVETFPGHIACSAMSKSEIVVPMFNAKGDFWGVLDVDSQFLAHFDEVDQNELEKICRSLEIVLNS